MSAPLGLPGKLWHHNGGHNIGAEEEITIPTAIVTLWHRWDLYFCPLVSACCHFGRHWYWVWWAQVHHTCNYLFFFCWFQRKKPGSWKQYPGWKHWSKSLACCTLPKTAQMLALYVSCVHHLQYKLSTSQSHSYGTEVMIHGLCCFWHHPIDPYWSYYTWISVTALP